MSGESEHYSRLSEIFDEARHLVGEARSEYLDRQCRSDRALRDEVDALLVAYERDDPDPLSENAVAAARGALEGFLPAAASGGDGGSEKGGWLPERVGPYRILRKIAEGGMGVVYEAEQDSPRRRIALKVVHPLFVNETRLKRFRQESELLGRLHHPGIAQVYEAGSYDIGQGPQPFFAMEFVDGSSLAKHAVDAQLPYRSRLALLAEVCDAVQHAHEMGVIHRDLKPDNILIDERGHPKVLDFGIARATEGSTVLTTLVTEEGDLLGTIAYMAPEQLVGVPEAITGRADVYALGVIAFELLAGRLPHDLVGLPLAVAVQMARDKEPDSLGSLRPEFKGDAETIVGKALEKDPDRRYPSAAGFAADLRAFLSNRPIAARPPSRIYRAVKFTRRNRPLVWGTAATLTAIILGIIASLIFAFRADQNADRARENEDLALENAIRASAGERMAVAGVMQAAQDLLERGDIWRGAFIFRRIVGEWRGWEVDFLTRAFPTMLPERYGTEPSFWVDDSHVAVASGDGFTVLETDTWTQAGRRFGEGRRLRKERIFDHPRQVQVRDQISSELHLIDPESGEILQPPSKAVGGTYAALFLDTAGRLWDHRSDGVTGELRVEVDGQALYRIPMVGAGSFLSPDGMHTAIVRTSDGVLFLYDSVTGALRGQVPGLEVTSCARVYFTPSGREVLAFDSEGRLAAVDVERVEVIRRYDAIAGRSCDGGDISPDGRWFSYPPRAKGSVDILDLETGAIVHSFPVDLQSVSNQVEFSPSGRRLLVSAVDIATVILDVDAMSATPEDFEGDGDPRALTYRSHEGFVHDFAISPDGRMVASMSPPDPYIRIWDIDTGETISTVAKPRGLSWSSGWDRGYLIALAPDGRRLLATVREDMTRPEFLVADLLTGSTVFEELPETLEDLSHLPWLDRFTEVLGPAQPMRLGRKAYLAMDGTAVATQESAGGQVREGSRWRAFLDKNSEDALGRSPDGERVAVTNDRTVRIFDSTTEEEIARIVGGAHSVDWSPDGRLIAAGGLDGRIRLIDVDLMAELYSFRAHTDTISCIAWTPDGSRIVSGSSDGLLRVWDARTRSAVSESREPYLQRITELRKLDGDELVFRHGNTDSVAERFAMLRVIMERQKDGEAVPTVLQSVLNLVEAGEGEAASERFAERDTARDGWETEFLARGLTSPSEESNEVGRTEPVPWDWNDDPRVTTYRGHGSYVYSVAISPDGRLAASACVTEPRVLLWDIATGEELATLTKPAARSAWLDNRGQLLAFSANGRRLLATARSGLGRPELLVYDLLTGERVSEPLAADLSDLSHLSWIDRFLEVRGPAPAGPLGRMAFQTEDGVAFAIHPLDQAFEVPAGDRWSTLAKMPRGESLCLSPDGKQAAVAGSDTFRVYGIDGSREGRVACPAYCVAWSPDGRRIAVGHSDGDLRILDGGSFEGLLGIQAHDDYVYSVVWTPDGSRIVTTSGDATVRVWDSRPPEERSADQAANTDRLRLLRGLTDDALMGRFESATSTIDRGALIRVAAERRKFGG